MPTVDVMDKQGNKVGEVELSDVVFAARVSDHVLWEVVRAQRAKKRAGTANSKGRSEVAGSTRKLYRQKGTGRGRHGSIKAPVYVGGGIAFGPKPRSFEIKVPRKVRRLAMRGALSLKVAEGKLVIVDDLGMDEYKTKSVAEMLDRFGARKGLVVDAADNEKLRRSTKNLSDHMFLPAEGLNVYDVLRHDVLVMSLDTAKAVDGKLSAEIGRTGRRSA